MRPVRSLSVLLALQAAASAQVAWLDAAEPSPFVPDRAAWIAQGGDEWLHCVRFSHRFPIQVSPRRAVLAVAPAQYAEVRLDGALIATGYDERECLPVFVDVTAGLTPGEHVLSVDVTSVWKPGLYLELRVAQADGQFTDLCSSDDWIVSDLASGAELGRAVETGGYHRRPGDGWIGREFALLPRAEVTATLEGHCDALRRAWEADRQGPVSEFAGRYERPEFAERFAGFERLDRSTGQLRDAQDREVHRFFTIYDQRRGGEWVLSVPEFDFDQLERDLNLMDEAHVNPQLRQLGWDVLLDGEGNWRPCVRQPAGTHLPEFRLVRDVLDYFLDRVEAHGLHVMLEADFYWSANPEVIFAPYRSRYHIYPEVLEAQALATRKVLNYFSRRTCVLGCMAGEEDIVVAHDLTNPHLAQLWHEYLARTYGTPEAFAASHASGCGTARPAALREVERTPEFVQGGAPVRALAPEFQRIDGPFAGLRSLADVPLPYWPPYFTTENPAVPARAHRSYNDFTPDDPLWIDYYGLVEEDLLFDMLCRWATIVREGCPGQLLFYSNAQDFTTSWHFLHLYRCAELPFDAIGVGCHDSGIRCSELEPWATVRKSLKNVSGYRAYVRANGALPVGIASGEGEGGVEPDDILDYYRGALFDEIGGGLAWTQTYNWTHISGGDDADGRGPRETPLLRWMGSFLERHERDPFPLADDVPALVVRNENLAHSNRSGLDYGNGLELGQALSQLNVAFDYAMDSHLTYGEAEPFGIDLARYRMVLLPTVACDLPDRAWRALEAWLTDPAYAGTRTLVVGLEENRSAYLAPTDGFPAALRRWLGRDDYAARELISGRQRVTLGAAPGGEYEFDFGSGTRLGLFEGDDVMLRLADGRGIGVERQYAGNAVVGLGFPLGLNTNDLWAAAPRQQPYDAYASLLDALVGAAGIERTAIAPHNVRVYPSADGRTILVRERFGLGFEGDIEVALPDGVSYAGAERLPSGRTRIPVHVVPYGGVALAAEE